MPDHVKLVDGSCGYLISIFLIVVSWSVLVTSCL